MTIRLNANLEHMRLQDRHSALCALLASIASTLIRLSFWTARLGRYRSAVQLHAKTALRIMSAETPPWLHARSIIIRCKEKASASPVPMASSATT